MAGRAGAALASPANLPVVQWKRVRADQGDWGRMDFTKDVVAQHFQDLILPQILAISAV